MNASSLGLLRRIALGLPLVVSLSGCSCQSPCTGASPESTMTLLDPETIVPHADGSATGDGGGGDAGASDPVSVAQSQCGRLCSQTSARGAPSWCGATASGTQILLSCQWPGMPCGRRADGVQSGLVSATSTLGAWLADAAHQEAASVLAFEDLAEELTLHGAPPTLARWALRSAHEERGHAASVGRLARAHGGGLRTPSRHAREPRPLFDVALDNAAEGLVRETYGALLAAYQAQRATDRDVARTFGRIAADEARHALFSLALDDWARSKLDASGCRALGEERRAAHAQLLATLDAAPDASAGVLGLPDADRARTLASLVA